MKAIFQFELKRSFPNSFIVVFLLFFLILQLFLQVGKTKYIETLNSRKDFQQIEREKVKKYKIYRQYGGVGILLMFIPSFYSILYNDSKFDNLFCTISLADSLNIHSPIKGKKFFTDKSGYLNFLGIFLLLIVLAALFYGIKTTNKKYLNFISKMLSPGMAFWPVVFSRLFIINIASYLLLFLSFLPLLIIDKINLYKDFSIQMLLGVGLVISFFFVLGCIIGKIKKKTILPAIVFTTYFLFVILFPWLSHLMSQVGASNIQQLFKFNSDNLMTLLLMEENLMKTFGHFKAGEAPSEEMIRTVKKSVNAAYKKIMGNEERMKKHILSKVRKKDFMSTFVPTLFYFSLCEGLSSEGGYSYIDFYTYCQIQKDRFINFILDKTYTQKEPGFPDKIENFVKADEDLFFSKPRIPDKFIPGVLVNFFYIVILISLTYYFHKKELRIHQSNINPEITFSKSKIIFVLCENDKVKEDIFNHYQTSGVATCLEKFDIADFQFHGIDAQVLFIHFCRITGIEEKRAMTNLKIMGVKNLKSVKLCKEMIFKIIVAVKMASNHNLIILKDILRNQPKKFEIDFFKLLSFLESEGKYIIYLSNEMFDTSDSFDKQIKIQRYKEFPLNLDKVTLR